MTVTQLNTLLDDIVALSFMREQGYPLGYGAPAYLYYAQRLYQVPLGVLGISLATAIFPVMSADAAKGDMRALAATIALGLRTTVFVAVPATAGIFLVARPLVSAIFEHGQFTSKDTPLVAMTLVCYALGLSAYFAQQVMTRAYYALQDARTPAKSAVAALGCNMVMNFTFLWFWGTAGLAVGTAVSAYVQVGQLILGLQRRLDTSVWQGVARTTAKTFLATGLMLLAGGGLLCLCRSWPCTRGFEVLRIALVVPIAAGCYVLVAHRLRIEPLSVLWKPETR